MDSVYNIYLAFFTKVVSGHAIEKDLLIRKNDGSHRYPTEAESLAAALGAADAKEALQPRGTPSEYLRSKADLVTEVQRLAG